MFEKYTDRARRVIFFARYEASSLGSLEIGTEHLLLAGLRERRDLQSILQVPIPSLDGVRAVIREIVPEGGRTSTSVDLPFSRDSRTVLEDAARQAGNLGHQNIGSTHLLLALLGNDRRTAQILSRIHVEIGAARERVLACLSEKRPSGAVDQGVPGGTPHLAGSRVAADATFWGVICDAMDEAVRLSQPSARPEHLLLALLRNEHSLAYSILRKYGLDVETVRRHLEAGNQPNAL
jgi:ATP-dependent Clp protease ATP-binding subunit ClpA